MLTSASRAPRTRSAPRRRSLVAASAALAGAVAVGGLVALAPSASAGEFLGNGGFETGTLSGWTCDAGSSAVTGQAHSGTWALKATPTSSATGQCEQTVGVAPSTTYTLTAQVKGSYVYIGVDGGTSTWTPGTGSGYGQLSVSFTTTASQTSAAVYVHGWYGQPVYYADDISLQGPGGGSTTPPPTTPPTTPPPTTPPTTPPPTTPPPTTTPPTTPPPTTPPPTSPPPSGGLPTHALVGYLHETFANGSGYLKLADVPDSWDVIDLAFGETDSPTSGSIHFNRCSVGECPSVESDADFKAAIQAKQAKGKKVLLSIGGANGEVQLTTTAARDAFVSSVGSIVDKWGLNGIDIDFEGHSLSLNTGDTDFKNPTTPVIVNLISALKSLKARYGSGFVLTMAPETFFVQMGYQYYGSGPWGGQDPRCGAYLPVIYALRDDLTLLHVQDYNSGSIMGLDNQYHSMGGADFHIAMTDMLLTGFPVAGNTANVFPALAPSQVAIGLPASTNAGNGYTAPAQVDQALDCLTKKTNCGGYGTHGTWPALRGLMTWSVNWDKFSNWEFQRTFDGYFGS
ncbi:chitinase [Actinacidiphila sp. ITFR-21]|uniref:chitinase n=1 Tax=Actinacidiphila sp. ITFR-21 TaxID=3075199 RepID=UPI00288B2F27|nr:glycosyl hydrolase family 18 protein [Streptomyces sp. ITFR-21]WNI17959.1 glycosyl hydrolase family 18 protein [Streptomyces sp. ITFR-21]